MKASALPLANPRARARRWIGIACVFLFIGALVFLAIWSGGGWHAREEYVVRFSVNTQVAKGSPVLLLGQPVGRVTRVAVVEDGGQPQVEVRFGIDGSHAAWMRTGTKVTEDSTLVGAPWLELQPGPAGGERLAAGSTVEGAIAPAMMDRLLELQPVITGLIEEVGTLVGTLNTTVERVDPILAQVEAQLGTTQQALTEVTTLIQTTHGMFEQIKTDQAVLVDGLAATLARVNEELLPGVEEMVAVSRSTVADAFGELEQTLDVLQTHLPGLMVVTQETLANTRDITEAAKHSWPFRSYWKRKAKEEAEAARKAAAATRR